MSEIKNISFILVASAIVVMFCNYLQTDFLFKYLTDNLISLLLTLLAINTATLGLIASKMQDIVADQPEFDFSRTIKEMKLSLLEQIVLISLSIIILILQDSKLFTIVHKATISNIILVGVLIYSINILWDTGKSVFVVIEELQKMRRNNGKQN
ncbi:MAG: hypothetical protein ACOYKE_02550 [Ferruginibacter sp.]